VGSRAMAVALPRAHAQRTACRDGASVLPDSRHAPVPEPVAVDAPRTGNDCLRWRCSEACAALLGVVCFFRRGDRQDVSEGARPACDSRRRQGRSSPHPLGDHTSVPTVGVDRPASIFAGIRVPRPGPQHKGSGCPLACRATMVLSADSVACRWRPVKPSPGPPTSWGLPVGGRAGCRRRRSGRQQGAQVDVPLRASRGSDNTLRVAVRGEHPSPPWPGPAIPGRRGERATPRERYVAPDQAEGAAMADSSTLCRNRPTPVLIRSRAGASQTASRPLGRLGRSPGHRRRASRDEIRSRRDVPRMGWSQSCRS
jgi:hypothetical protein